VPKPIGRPGSWFAKWNGESLPCIHSHWTKGHWPFYLDAGLDDRPEWPAFVEALRVGGKAILTTSHEADQIGIRRRKSYVALWTVTDVIAADGELRFKLADQLERFD